LELLTVKSGFKRLTAVGQYPYYQIPCRKAANRDRQKLADLGTAKFDKKLNGVGSLFQRAVSTHNCHQFKFPNGSILAYSGQSIPINWQ